MIRTGYRDSVRSRTSLSGSAALSVEGVWGRQGGAAIQPGGRGQHWPAGKQRVVPRVSVLSLGRRGGAVGREGASDALPERL